MEYFLISPAQHQIHHSLEEKHYDKNFGATLSIWDWFGGSLHHSEISKPEKLGLKGDEFKENPNIAYLYIRPIVEIYSLLQNKIKSITSAFKKFLNFISRAKNHIFINKET